MHLRSGLYFIFIVFLTSCVSHDINKPVPCSKSGLELNLSSTTPASSCSQADGEIVVTATGGELPYRFQVNDGLLQTENIFRSISSGIHNVTVVDKNGCSSTLSNIVVPAENFKFTASIVSNTECVNYNGSITLDVQEGTAPFSYKLNEGSFSENNSFLNLKAGSYVITIVDAASCTVSLNITVPQANTNTSWTNDILPIMKTTCAVNGCHDGKTRIDYRLYSNALKNAANIKLYTQDGRMPFDGLALSQSQIDLIACWVNEGALQN